MTILHLFCGCVRSHRLPVCLSVCLSVCVCLYSVCLPRAGSVRSLPSHRRAHQNARLYVCLLVCPTNCLVVCVCVCFVLSLSCICSLFHVLCIVYLTRRSLCVCVLYACVSVGVVACTTFAIVCNALDARAAATQMDGFTVADISRVGTSVTLFVRLSVFWGLIPFVLALSNHNKQTKPNQTTITNNTTIYNNSTTCGAGGVVAHIGQRERTATSESYNPPGQGPA